ncbi:MAG: J domain-containing protein [Sphingomonadales bacterium]
MRLIDHIQRKGLQRLGQFGSNSFSNSHDPLQSISPRGRRLPAPGYKSILCWMANREQNKTTSIARDDKALEPRASGGVRICEWPGCREEGAHQAPKSRQDLKLKIWFCLEHIRLYNASWNYFAGMTEAEIEDYRRTSVIGHRPTWPMNGSARPGPEGMHAEFAALRERLFGQEGLAGGAFDSASREHSRPTSGQPEQSALAVLGLDATATLADIKKRYKELVKRYHPDVRRSGKANEERLKRVIGAYHRLTGRRSSRLRNKGV